MGRAWSWELWWEFEVWNLLPLKTSVVGGLRQISVPGPAVMVNVSVGAMLELLFEDRQFRSLEGLGDTGKMVQE